MEDRRLRLENPFSWIHHRSGWKEAINALHSLHHSRGVYFESFLEGRHEPVTEPFIGVLHHTPGHPVHLHPWDLQAKYRRVPDLKAFLEGPVWTASLPYCKGLITLSEHTARFVRDRTEVPVQVLLHPHRPPNPAPRWSSRPRTLLFVGSWLRDFRAFFHLKAPRFEKTFVVPFPWVRGEIERLGLVDPEIRYLVGLSPARYDRWLARSVVFLKLFDASAVNTVLDCMFHHTPLVVNRLPALEEYLGPEYPLFYEHLDEAEALLADPARLQRGHEYLKGMDKTRFTPGHFVSALQASEMYRGLPRPGDAQ